MYYNIKIGKETYSQRKEFSKITILNNDGKTFQVDNLEELPEFQKTIIKNAILMLENPDDFFTYEINEKDEVTITSYIGKLKHIVIPEEIKGRKVTNITAIFNDKDIKSVILPDSITKLPACFCSEITDLSFVQLSPFIKEIPSSAFAKCVNLKYINLDNIETIGPYALEFCQKLEEVNLQNIKTLQLFAFANCYMIKNIELPNLESISENAFCDCHNLESVILSDKVSELKDQTFMRCKKLAKIILPKNLESIGVSAFYKCENLENIEFPESLKIIKTYAFNDSGLKGEIIFPKELKQIDSRAFFVNGEITKINISENTDYQDDSFTINDILKIKKYEKQEKQSINIARDTTNTR